MNEDHPTTFAICTSINGQAVDECSEDLSGCVSFSWLYTVVREFFAYKIFHVLKFRVKNFSDIAYLSEKILTRNFKTCASQIRRRAHSEREPADHGRVRKTLLYSRLPCLSGSMDGSSWRRATSCTGHVSCPCPW